MQSGGTLLAARRRRRSPFPLDSHTRTSSRLARTELGSADKLRTTTAERSLLPCTLLRVRRTLSPLTDARTSGLSPLSPVHPPCEYVLPLEEQYKP